MSKKIIKCKFINGFHLHNLQNILDNIDLSFEYNVIEASNPDIIFFGPYGPDLPKSGNYLRVGVSPECITPMLSHSEFAFGAISEDFVDSERYMKFEFWGYSPSQLINKKNKSITEEREFCSFFYSHKMAYRESFFSQLNTYKKVNSPGKSMNNMESVDNPNISRYDAKSNFLSKHKFDVAFENFSHPGYCTEKLFGSLLSGSLPIYFGDPEIHSSFLNSKSFINGFDFIKPKHKDIIKLLEKTCVENQRDYTPSFNYTIFNKVQRKLKYLGRRYKMNLLTNGFDFKNLINHIIEVDNDQKIYESYWNQNWCFEDKITAELERQRNAWRKIFDAR